MTVDQQCEPSAEELLLCDPEAWGELPDVIPDWVFEGPLPQEPPTCSCDCAAHDDDDSSRPVGLLAAVDVFCATQPGRQFEEQALTDAETLLLAVQKLRVHGVEQIADVQDRQLHQLAGARSTAAWLKTVRPDADVSDVGFAEHGRNLHWLKAGVRDERVSITAAKRVVRALRTCGPWVDREDGLIDGQPGDEVITGVVRNVVPLVCQQHLGLDDLDPLLSALTEEVEAILAAGGSQLLVLEKAFTLLAEHVPPRPLTRMLRDLFFALVPSELERLAAEAEAKAELSLDLKPDGLAELRGRLSPECSERLYTALLSEMRRDPANPMDTLAAGGLTDDLPRDLRSRMHEALNRLLGRYLEQGLGGVHSKVPVQVNVTIADGSLTGQLGALPATGDSGQPIPRSLLRRWWCDSRVTAFVLTQGGKALRSIHVGRTLTAVERRAALLEHGHRCAGVGCCRGESRAGPDWDTDLQPHHARRYADDGVTCLEETVLACKGLHADIHERGLTVRLRDGRYLRESGFVDGPAERTKPPF